MSTYDDRIIAAQESKERVEEAYKVISHALNVGAEADVLAAVRSEHSTLLGKLGNVVMEAIGERPHDGRLCDFNDKLGTKAGILGPDTKVSDVRQRFI